MSVDASIRLLRHATLVVQYRGRSLLVDPMLSEPAAFPPFENTPNDRRNPLVELPQFDLAGIDAVLVTHLHTDHFDEAAAEAIPNSMPIFCQPEDHQELAGRGFQDVRPVDEAATFENITITRTPAQHGHGELAEQMGPASGFVLEASDEPTVYIAGDTVWYPEVESVIDAHQPTVIVLNAGGARFTDGRPITMTASDVEAVCEAAPAATIIPVHMEAINHCLETRADLAAGLEGTGCTDRVVIPADGEHLELTAR